MNRYAGYHILHGGFDPTGLVVIFVHGINSDNIADTRDGVYPGLMKGWADRKGNSQAFIHFKYGQPDGGKSPPNEQEAILGLSSSLNKNAAKSLAELLTHLDNQRKDLGCDERIFLIAYSNGGNVAYLALEDTQVDIDMTILIGGSLDRRYHFSNEQLGRAGWVVNFWSESDTATQLPTISGVGASGLRPRSFDQGGYELVEGMTQDAPNIVNRRIEKVAHSSGEAKKLHDLSVDTTVDARNDKGYTAWPSFYLSREYYSRLTREADKCCLSAKGSLPDGTPLETTWHLYDSNTRRDP